jgi:hypothetical protein
MTYTNGNSTASDSQYTKCVIQFQLCVRKHSLKATANVNAMNTAVPTPDRSCARPLRSGVVSVYHGRKNTGKECHVPATIHRKNSLAGQQATKDAASEQESIKPYRVSLQHAN